MREALSKEEKVQIGSRIKIARDRAGFSQEKLAELIEKSTQYISDLERGVTGASLATVIRICEVLHTSCDFILLGRKNESVHEAIVEFDYLTDIEKDVINRGIQLYLEALSYKK